MSACRELVRKLEEALAVSGVFSHLGVQKVTRTSLKGVFEEGLLNEKLPFPLNFLL